MFKGLLFFGLLLGLIFPVFSSNDRVGDNILLSGAYQGGTLRIEGSYLQFNGSAMMQRQSSYFNGQHMSQEDTWIASEDLITPETAGMMVALCPNLGGTHEYLDLPVGRTLTCRLESSSLDELPLLYSENFKNLGDVLWVGPFPVLGVAQIQIPGAMLKVQSYRWN